MQAHGYGLQKKDDTEGGGGMIGRLAFIIMIFGQVASSLLAAGLLAAGPQLASASETLTHHGTYSDWQVFRLDRGDFTACYGASKASHFFPRGPTRTRPILYVVRYPKTTTSNTVEFRFGQNISSYQSVTANLIARRKQPRDSFSLTTKTNTGFIPGRADQTAFVRAMVKGRQVVVVSQPGVIEILEDRYSLYGFTKALAKLEALCPGPRPAEPLGLKGPIIGDAKAKPQETAIPPKDTPK